MKALTLTQPWASLMACQKKTIETRSWWTGYRGELVIHAAKGYPVWAKNLAWQPDFRLALGMDVDVEHLPRGVGLCIVNLIAVVSTDQMHRIELATGQKPSASEIPFGDYSPGRYAWVTKFVKALGPSVPVRGAQGLWNWPEVDL